LEKSSPSLDMLAFAKRLSTVALSFTGLRMVLYPLGCSLSRFNAMATLNVARPFLNQFFGILLRITHGGTPGSSLKKVCPCSPYSNRVNVLLGTGALVAGTGAATGFIRVGCFSMVASCQSTVWFDTDMLSCLLMLILCLLLIVSLILIGYGLFYSIREIFFSFAVLMCLLFVCVRILFLLCCVFVV